MTDPQPAAYQCPRCDRVAPWTDGQSREAGDGTDEFWCQTCGAETPLTATPSLAELGASDWVSWRAGWYQLSTAAPPRFIGNPPEPFTAEAGGQQITTWVAIPIDPQDIP